MTSRCSTLLGCLIIPALCTPQGGASFNLCFLQVKPVPAAANQTWVLPDNDLATTQDEVQPPEPLLGFRIGTSAGHANVVKNGVLVDAFQGGASSHSKILSDQPASWFYPSYDVATADAPNSIDIADVTAMSSDDSVVTVKVLRPIRRPGGHRSFSLLAGGVSGVSQFAYECHSAGEAIIRLEFHLRDKRRLSPVILMRKLCKALSIPGIALGTALSPSSIVQDGNSHWTKEKSPVIPFETTSLSLFATKTSIMLANVSFEAPQVQVLAQSWGLDHANVSKASPHRQSSMGRQQSESVLNVFLESPWARSGGTLIFGRPEEISLKFQCLHPGVALVELLLTPQPAWQPYKPFNVYMRKVCGGVHKRGLQIGSYAGGSDVVKDGIVRGTLPKISLLVHSSHFFIRYPSFEDGDPQLEPLPQVHCVAAKEDAAGRPSPVEAFLAVSSGMGQQEVTITYQCKRAAPANCQLDLGLHFWQPLVLHWQKSCGGIRPDAVIKSDLPFFSEVFNAGRVAPAWAKMEPAVELPREQSTAGFIISSNNSVFAEDLEPLTLGRPVISVSNPKVLEVALLSDTLLHGHVVQRSGMVGITTQHLCKEDGDAVVHVKVPFLPHLPNGTSLLSEDSDAIMQFDAAEFSYKKHCAPKRMYWAYALVSFGILIFILGFVGSTGFALSKSRQFNRSVGQVMEPVYGAAAQQQHGLEQKGQRKAQIGSELESTADHI